MQTYKKLFTYWFALIIYDLTVEFCQRWIRSWKLREQMTGAARSGKQNIVEGSEALKTSLKMGIKLTNTARISLEELLRYLGAQREWQKNLPLPKDPEEAANLIITLCHQATYLMNKQVKALERKHQTEGGYTEKLYRKRKNYRGY